jgi:UDP-N-acetyl-2-amino-2-deoxyglucuronate dehydrogenase
MKDFALIGAAGFIAPKHMNAIKATGNQLVAAMDKSDSVGIMDSYFPKASFFTEFERFDRHLEKLRRKGQPIDYLSVCTPNYLHDAHIRFGLRQGAHVICEKPMVINPWNVEALQLLQEETGKKVYNILQMRLHPAIIALKEKIANAAPDERFDINLTYITARGKWYYASWKGELEKSGGIATNIGIHFFDFLIWIFGTVKENIVHIHTHDRAAGYLQFEKADVQWFLSINEDLLPETSKKKGEHVFRSLKICGEEINLNQGLQDLHNLCYEKILNNQGFLMDEALPAIELANRIRNQKPVGIKNDHHPLASFPLSKHPFDS